MRERWYDPDRGSWLSPDPEGYGNSPNLYAFGANDPVNQSDPTGLALYAFDGTWNDRNHMKNPTNVAKLAAVYSSEVVYKPGVGTRWYSSWAGGAAGLGARRRLNEAFKELEDIYNGRNGHTKDQDIDIIGFSRGAAEAREFANMINTRGVRDDETGQIAYPFVRFMGLFDTVASFGIPGNNTNLTYHLDLAPNVETARQAIAGNEYRGSFPLSRLSNEDCPDPRVAERPFPGAHSDIGGGYPDGQLSRAPLAWMWQEMHEAGLPMKSVVSERHQDRR